ncbi:MAG: glutamate racemase [Candidatus Liptonbacteria bacterium]|nr:glutamate racemase [Candidatus Liptonbacteria bacterium]
MKSNAGSNSSNIGVFDSGFGGLIVLRGIVKKLPRYNYIYLGDTARNPYGTRSKETVYKFTKEAIDFLFKKNCELIILACNTASGDALRKIQREYLIKKYPNRKILGVLIPASEEAARITKNKRIGVIATEGTVQSDSFMREANKLNPKIKLFQKACPLLVPIVETGEQNSKAAELILENYLRPLKKRGIDTLILGCTHYGIFGNKIRKIMGKKILIVSEERIVPEKLRTYLKKHKEIEKKLAKNRRIEFYSTDLTDKFKILGSKFFGKSIRVQKAVLK